MDPVTPILIAGVLGGLAIAWLIARKGPRSNALSDVPLESTAIDVINVSRIRAAGIGGLGLFAMALVVAWFVPRIGLTLGAGALLGVLLGAALILRRRRAGPLPSSGASAGANVILSIDRPAESGNDDTAPPAPRLRVAPAQRAG